MALELESFVGSWILDETDNFEEYMKAIGKIYKFFTV